MIWLVVQYCHNQFLFNIPAYETKQNKIWAKRASKITRFGVWHSPVGTLIPFQVQVRMFLRLLHIAFGSDKGRCLCLLAEWLRTHWTETDRNIIWMLIDDLQPLKVLVVKLDFWPSLLKKREVLSHLPPRKGDWRRDQSKPTGESFWFWDWDLVYENLSLVVRSLVMWLNRGRV